MIEENDDLDSTEVESELEKQFREEAEKVGKQIDAATKRASEALWEAIRLSEKNGIPFYSNISFIRQSYFPNTFSNKWQEIDIDFVEEITSAYSDYTEGGWEHSAVC